jgi:hypothetical protein
VGAYPRLPHGDAFGPQQLRLLALVAGHQPAGTVHHSPPGQIVVGERQQAPDEAAELRVTGIGGDVAVRDHLAGTQRPDDVEDATVAVGVGHAEVTRAAS